MWPTQFILATLEIKLTNKLEDILTIPEMFVKQATARRLTENANTVNKLNRQETKGQVRFDQKGQQAYEIYV